MNNATVLKNLKGETLWDFLATILLQSFKKIEGTLWSNLKFFEKQSYSTEI